MQNSSQEIRVIAFAACAIVGLGCWRWFYCRENKNSLKFPLPESIRWLDQDSYDCLTSICDTFVPAIADRSQCNERALNAALNTINPLLFQMRCALTVPELLKNQEYLMSGAIDANIHNVVAKAVDMLSSKFEQQQLFVLLKVLNTSIGNFLLFGIPVAFPDLSLDQRVKLLSRLRDSYLPPLRAAYQNFRRLTQNLFLSYAETGKANSAWKAIGYAPQETVSKQNNKPPLVTADEEAYLRDEISTNHLDVVARESFNAIVVGSGSGGGVIASELVKAGLDVLVLEKGAYFRAQEFREWRESEAMYHAFEKGGLCSSDDGNIVVLAGSSVGGGSTINWSASFRPPAFVREEWVQEGLEEFREGGRFDESLDAVHRLVNVNADNSHHSCEGTACCDGRENTSFAVNGNNELLWNAARKLGYVPEKIPRNVKSCVDCGHCCFGCSYESKQSTTTALLEPLLLGQRSGRNAALGYGRLRILPHCKVLRVLHEENAAAAGGTAARRVTGVEAEVSVQGPPPVRTAESVSRYNTIETRKLALKADLVVSAAGTLHTPALLLRSGFTNRMIGKNLTLHPVLGVSGYFPPEVKTRLASGVSMGVVVREPPIRAEGVAEANHRVAIETPPVHPGILGLVLPWKEGLQLKISSLIWQNMGLFIGISRDRNHLRNCVYLDSEGEPAIRYDLNHADVPMLLKGLEVSLRLMRAAGASMVFYGHENFPWFIAEPGLTAAEEDARFEQYVAAVLKEGYVPMKTLVFSAHQMGTCRMAATPAKGPTSPRGELFECSGLYVADGSVLPTSLGVNPMITIESFAHYIGRNIVNSDLSEAVKRKITESKKRKIEEKW